ncbi:uncharacterized protein LOC133860461 [Alnus glutinosa]|uniref:uncharacterized protein LOC133860461 n=1 Tax=Alnus glutinosa TaxID=3517 RepID=UPI002D766934|nr:uncharacterized protein LOC133860461 [Alnus glutinosa]
MHFSQRHISVNINVREQESSWTFTRFYGNPNRALREDSWSLLSYLSSLSKGAWLCMGDFNEIVDLSEKYGGAVRNEDQMERFRSTLEECNMGDLGYKGSKYTWVNNIESAEFIKERLDRAIATPSWCEAFPNAIVKVLPVSNSDHKPLLLTFDVTYKKPPRLFRYEAKWNLDEDCHKVIQQTWNENVSSGNSMTDVLQSLNKSKASLNGWRRAKFGSTTRTINSLNTRLERLQRQELPRILATIKRVQGDLNKLLDMEDMKWRQRTKRNWFNNGDRNTEYFHAWAYQRHRSNFIGSIQDLEGHVWNQPEEVGRAFTRFFKISSNPREWKLWFYSSLYYRSQNGDLKAYDRVEWPFLEAMMRTMGFEEIWISLIMDCVRSVTYSVLVNGQSYGKISPSCGLRPGDLLSPYLFLIVAEGLSSLMAKAEAEKHITGVPIAVSGFQLSHLFFANDSLLLCRANFMEWINLFQVLQTYEKASGQQLNAAKTFIFFSRNTRAEFQGFIRNTAGATITTRFEKYLGLPAMVDRSKRQTFASICGKVKAKVDGWKEKFLSQVVKEILIKAVVQALPTYCMSVFWQLQSLCKSLNSIMSRFWWGHKSNQGRVHWMRWERLGTPKNRGVMGFRDLEIFNLALLAKQGWRSLSNPSTLVAHIMKEKYYPRVDFMEAQLGRRPSFVWSSIIKARPLVQNGWGGEVSLLIDPLTRWWNLDLVRDIFDPREAARIGSVMLSPLNQKDKLIWRGTTIGTFTVRNANHMAMNRLAQSKGEGSGANNHVEVMAAAKASVEGFNLATNSAEASPRAMQLPQPKWKKAQESTWKIN